jgi:hypothetical protein
MPLVQARSDLPQQFTFRPWVRRAGLSILLVASGATAAIGAALLLSPAARYGWFGEKAVWVYIVTLWLGGAKVFASTLRPIAVADAEQLILRPIHHLRGRSMRWSDVLGTEQMIGGDRLIVYHQTPRGMRFVALNLNLVKGRREFLMLLDARLRAMGFEEKTVERSRYLSRGGATPLHR